MGDVPDGESEGDGDGLDVDREPLPVAVVSERLMDVETFNNHLNARHLADLGLHSLTHQPLASDGYWDVLVVYHDRLHALNIRDFDHYHLPADES
jgi:hypothetical protein